MNSILLEVNGIQYSNFESAEVGFDLDAIASYFYFLAVSTKKQPLPFKQNDKCAIYLDDQKVLTGFIEAIDISYDSSSHSISVTGRSKTADIVDSMINTLELIGNITLKEVIEKVISHIGADIKVIENDIDIKKFNAAEDKISPEVGENAFDFIEKLARKRQVLLTTNGDGDVVLTQTGKTSAPSNLQNVIGATDNNIESASVSYDNTDRFGKYVAKSQLNVAAANFGGDMKSKDIVAQKSTDLIDEEVRSSRQLVIQSESASSDEQNEKRIKWEANIRKARSIVYSTKMFQFSIDGVLWFPNQLAKVKDDFAGIDDFMLINNVSFSQDINGSVVDLSLVDKNSYSLKLNEPAEGGKTGVGVVPQFN